MTRESGRRHAQRRHGPSHIRFTVSCASPAGEAKGIHDETSRRTPVYARQSEVLFTVRIHKHTIIHCPQAGRPHSCCASPSLAFAAYESTLRCKEHVWAKLPAHTQFLCDLSTCASDSQKRDRDVRRGLCLVCRTMKVLASTHSSVTAAAGVRPLMRPHTHFWVMSLSAAARHHIAPNPLYTMSRIFLAAASTEIRLPTPRSVSSSSRSSLPSSDALLLICTTRVTHAGQRAAHG